MPPIVFLDGVRTANPVPEPVPWRLTGFVLAGLWVAYRRQRAARPQSAA